MSYKHCNPCNNFDLCPSCEQEICVTCGENFDSEHMHLNDKAHQKLVSLIQEEMLMPAVLCRECLFYTYHNINDPEQENYNHNLIYKVKEEIIEIEKPYRGKDTRIKKSIAIIGKKPKREFTTRKGPFYFQPPGE